MSDRAEDLAERLRQSVQGCTLHNHGPVQAWAAIEEAVARGEVERSQVSALAIAACTHRLAELRASGSAHDARTRKEEMTLQFIRRLLGAADEAA